MLINIMIALLYLEIGLLCYYLLKVTDQYKKVVNTTPLFLIAIYILFWPFWFLSLAKRVKRKFKEEF